MKRAFKKKCDKCFATCNCSISKNKKKAKTLFKEFEEPLLDAPKCGRCLNQCKCKTESNDYNRMIYLMTKSIQK